MSSTQKRSPARSPGALAEAWDRRTLLVKREVAAANAASDAKTARLKALRLEKEREEVEAVSRSESATKVSHQRIKR
jgi:hypothetical protein